MFESEKCCVWFGFVVLSQVSLWISENPLSLLEIVWIFGR